MAVPDFQSLMLPLLELARDGEIHSVQEAYDTMAAWFDVSEGSLRFLPRGPRANGLEVDSRGASKSAARWEHTATECSYDHISKP